MSARHAVPQRARRDYSPSGAGTDRQPSGRDLGTDGLEAVETIATAAYTRILRVCTFARLSLCDAEDVAQDIWVWLLESGRSAEAMNPRWIAAVTLNYVRRLRRAQFRRAARESRACSSPDSEATDVETRISFDEIECCLRGLERGMLRLVRQGATFAEASRRLRIPRGSSDYYRKLLYRQISSRIRVERARTSSAPSET